MYRILQTGRTGLDALQKKIDVISNNIANAQTHGYKSLEVQFEDLVYDEVAKRGVPLSREAREKPIAIGTGSRIKSTERVFGQGIPQETFNPYDLAIVGQGFFVVQDQNGDLFLTRDGAFGIDARGDLVDSRGNYVLMDSYQSLSGYTDRDITINEDGYIIGITETGQDITLGKIRLYDVADKNMLMSKGNNYFSIEQVGNIYQINNGVNGESKIRQGFLEKSSVDIGKEMVDMLVTQRAYQINTKSIHAADEMWSIVNQLKR